MFVMDTRFYFDKISPECKVEAITPEEFEQLKEANQQLINEESNVKR